MTSPRAQRGQRPQAAGQPAIVTVADVPPDELDRRFAAVIDSAYVGELERSTGTSPELELEAALNAWRSDVGASACQRWDCDNHECPGRPAWDVALSDALSDALWTESLEEHVADFVRDWITERLLAFAKSHPEARLATVTV